MKAKDVRIGGVYEAKVNGKPIRVRIDTAAEYGGWIGTNLQTGYSIRIHTAGRLKPLETVPPTCEAELRRQWQRLKKANPNTVLLFHANDGFQVYGDDATVCEEMGLATAMRAAGVSLETPAAKFPHASLEANIGRLVAAGHKVAVCERVQPGEAKGKPVETIIT